MAFVGTAELILFEIAIVAFVGLAVPQFARYFSERKYEYAKLTADISWAPPAFLFGLVWSIMYLVLLPLAVYRVRILGNWEAGINQSALIVFWILQFTLMLYNFLYIVSLWLGFVVVLLAFGLAISTTWLFFRLDTFAGVLVIPLDIWLLYATLLALVIALKNRTAEPLVAYMRMQATHGGRIGYSQLPQSSAARSRGLSQPAPRGRMQAEGFAATAASAAASPPPPAAQPPPRTRMQADGFMPTAAASPPPRGAPQPQRLARSTQHV